MIAVLWRRASAGWLRGLRFKAVVSHVAGITSALPAPCGEKVGLMDVTLLDLQAR